MAPPSDPRPLLTAAAHAALRRSGVLEAAKVRVAVLEGNGGISVIPRDNPAGGA